MRTELDGYDHDHDLIVLGSSQLIYMRINSLFSCRGISNDVCLLTVFVAGLSNLVGLQFTDFRSVLDSSVQLPSATS
jgi:hypothetical protein